MADSGSSCAPAKVTDTTNKERIHECSTVNSCYDFGQHAYSNAKCGETESCGTWRKKGDILLQGCILSEYCGIDAEYEKHPTKYNCPQGAKRIIKKPATPVTPDTTPSTTPATTPTRPDPKNTTPATPATPDATLKPDSKGRTPLFNLLGYTDLDILDGLSGLAGGLMKKDVRSQFDGCYGGIPKIVEQSEVEFKSIDWKDLLNWTKDWAEVQESWSFVQNIIKEVPEEITSCSLIITDIIGFIMNLIHTINWALLWTGMTTGAMGLMMGMMAKGTDVGVAFAAHDFYRLGNDVGMMINTILDLGVDKTAA